jgi:protocatechuate 3,4-dioxygenase beta subunit
MPLSRRDFIAGTAFASAAVLLGACSDDEESVEEPRAGDSAGTTQSTQLEPTPACGDDHGATPEQTEGPYYTPDTPKRTNLVEDGVSGDRLVLAGTVLGTDCKPIANALLDFWQADGDGEYDNEGYRLRGHQFTDSRGRFTLTTVAPGLYPGRTRHIHVKVQKRGGEVLTTQLYFPGEAQNAQDGIFDEALVMDVDGSRARYDFVLA